MMSPYQYSNSLNPDRQPLLAFLDSTSACVIVGLFAASVCFFSIAGLRAAWASPEYKGYAWVPGVLLFLSLCLLAPACVRLFQRLIFAVQGQFDEGGELPF